MKGVYIRLRVCTSGKGCVRTSGEGCVHQVKEVYMRFIR